MALEMGIRPRDFWRMTLREFFYFVHASNRAKEQEFKLQQALIWQREALRRQKRLMSMQSFLMERKTRVPTGEELEKLRSEHAHVVGDYLAQKKAE